MNNLTWKCHICGAERPDDKISVVTLDVSKEHNLPDGTMKFNIRYCNDDLKCIKEAPNVRF